MKRSFQHFDECIPAEVWERFPDHKAALDRIVKVENDMQRIWRNKRRTALAENCEPAIKSKLLRVFIRSDFFPSTEKGQSFFIVTIEGRLHEDNLMEVHHFGSFFDSIKLVVDKKGGQSTQLHMLEWNAKSNPEGRQADCFRFKIFLEKPCTVKFYLSRCHEVQTRFDLPLCIRNCLPNIRWDPTEEDIIMGLWSYIMSKGLLDSKNKTLVKADEVMHPYYN